MCLNDSGEETNEAGEEEEDDQERVSLFYYFLTRGLSLLLRRIVQMRI